MPSQSELGSAIDSDPSVAACADSFLLDSFKDSGSLAVDLSYSSVRGRLRKFVDFWRTLEVSQFVLNVIMQGYKIPFFQLPTPFAKRNNASARENSDFVSQAVNDLLRLDLIEELACKPNIINPLSVSIRSSGKQRLILDLRHVNQFLYKQKFKCEDLGVATQLFDRNYYLFKFDLKSGYHHIEIFPDHRKFLAFEWDFGNGVSRYFQFCVLPFGLSSAPYIFTSILKPLQKSWRSQGIPIAIFLDDGLGGGTDFVSAKVNSLVVHSDLLKSGFVPNEEKSLWEPVQVITWLGVVLDTIDGTIKATEERIEKLNAGLVELLSCQPPRKVHVKRVASVTGQIISLSPCVGSVARIMTRFLFSVVNSARSWESEVFPSDDSLSEISFLNSKVCWSVQSLPVKVTFSDASNSACGAFVKNSNLVFHQNWSPVERAQSSTWRELKAVCLALEAFASHFSGVKVIWYSDNQNVESILQNSSREADMHQLALLVIQICLEFHISLEVKWIPWELNAKADAISNLTDYDDYTINEAIFQRINLFWGPHTVDRFACSYNAKVPRFNTEIFSDWLCSSRCLLPRLGAR